MNSNEMIAWLNERDPFHVWALNDDIYCLHCDGVFKAQDVIGVEHDWPNCPVCNASSPLDFHSIPWWREDLIDEVEVEDDIDRRWIGEPIQAEAGKPGHLPPRPGDPQLN